MASFDFVDCSSRAYRFVWEKRVEVVRLSAMVLTLKILSFVAFVAFGIQDQVLRHGLYLLPTYMLEGWVIAQLMLMALYSYEQGRPSAVKRIMPPPEDFERNVKASMIAYVLIKLMLSFVVGMTFEGEQALPDTPPSPPTLQTFFLAFMMMVFAFWSFRFFWVYVPFIIGRGAIDYLDRFRAFMSSFYLLGVWFMCFIPVALFMILISKILLLVFGVLGVSADGVVFESVLGAVQGVMDYAMSLVASIGVAYGIYSVFAEENRTTDLW